MSAFLRAHAADGGNGWLLRRHAHALAQHVPQHGIILPLSDTEVEGAPKVPAGHAQAAHDLRDPESEHDLRLRAPWHCPERLLGAHRLNCNEELHMH